VSSLQELEAMREGTNELRERVTDGDAMLREAGTTFLDGLEQLQDLRRVETSVVASCQVRSSPSCCTLQASCLKAPAGAGEGRGPVNLQTGSLPGGSACIS